MYRLNVQHLVTLLFNRLFYIVAKILKIFDQYFARFEQLYYFYGYFADIKSSSSVAGISII